MYPKRIMICRHGESEGQADFSKYGVIPDHKLVLTPKGRTQATELGKKVKGIIGNENIHIWCSPYARTRLTAGCVFGEVSGQTYAGKVYEDPRLREQERGNFRQQPLIDQLEAEREKYGTFFYRFPAGGESGADVYDRISLFLETLYRDFDNPEYKVDNTLLVMHGLTMRIFGMRFFHWPYDEFERLRNPANCSLYILEGNSRGYNLITPFEYKKTGEHEPALPAL